MQNCAQQAFSCCFDELGGVLYTHGLEYATIIDFGNRLNNYSKARESLDLQIGRLPHVKTKYYQQHVNKNSSFIKKDHSASDPNSSTSTCRTSTKPLSIICPIDQGNHYFGRCPEFKKLPLDKRLEIVKKHSLCFNCLYKHKLNDCRSEKRYMQDNCGQKQHSSLHKEKSGIDSKNESQKSNNVEVEQRNLSLPDADDSINPDSLSVIRNQLQYMPRLTTTNTLGQRDIFHRSKKAVAYRATVIRYRDSKLLTWSKYQLENEPSFCSSLWWCVRETRSDD